MLKSIKVSKPIVMYLLTRNSKSKWRILFEISVTNKTWVDELVTVFIHYTNLSLLVGETSPLEGSLKERVEISVYPDSWLNVRRFVCFKRVVLGDNFLTALFLQNSKLKYGYSFFQKTNNSQLQTFTFLLFNWTLVLNFILLK